MRVARKNAILPFRGKKESDFGGFLPPALSWPCPERPNRSDLGSRCCPGSDAVKPGLQRNGVFCHACSQPAALRLTLAGAPAGGQLQRSGRKGQEFAMQTTAQENGRLWGTRARDWAEVQEATLEPVFRHVCRVTGLGPGQAHLDIGCGAGRMVALAAQAGALATGFDASAAMLGQARTRTPQAAFHQGDMEALPFADAHFNVVTAINAFQYAANPENALAEACRVLAPGGTIAIVTWGDTENMEAARFNACLRPLMPPPPPDAPHPFNLSTATALEAFARNAGLEPLDLVEIDSPWCYPDRATALRGVLSAGVVVRAMEILGQDVVRAAYGQALEAFRLPDGSYRIGAAFRCLLARG
ncbi:MAG TPA: SAM-dependent methyltransferase [Aliiroseovarius sp.]|nr:SAM-dependent methyltransferase [Aliiroseovarius sp.]